MASLNASKRGPSARPPPVGKPPAPPRPTAAPPRQGPVVPVAVAVSGLWLPEEFAGIAVHLHVRPRRPPANK